MVITDVFFDLDRTLWDFDTNSNRALKTIFKQLNLDRVIEDSTVFIEDYIRINEKLWDDYRKGLTTKEILRVQRFHEALKNHGVEDMDLATHYCELYIDFCPQLTTTFPGTHETLKELKELGKRLHIITNGFSEVQYKKLKNCGIIDFFDVIICSDEVGVNKPEPEIFKIALRDAQTKSRSSAMIGDHPQIDVLGANQVGMRGILFDPHVHYSHNPAMEKITALNEIPNLLLGLKV